MMLIIFVFTFFYCSLIGYFIIGFDKVEVFNEQFLVEETKFSIVIPFRNEAENLPDLLQSLSELEYSKHLFEILFIDDASEDDSVEIIHGFITQHHTLSIENKKNIRVTNSPKKDAITTAIYSAKNEWIITTDADCIVPKLWLKTLDAFIQKHNLEMIIAPVTYSVSNIFFEQFQLLDFLSLQSATIAGFGIGKPFLCNGANLTYKKEEFKLLKGFEGNTNIASGDDIFLMEKFLIKHPKKVMCLKSLNALVSTKPQDSVANLIQQRLRWAAKTASYNNSFGKIVGLVVLSMNVIIISVALLSFLNVIKLKYLILIFVLKFFLDLFLIRKSVHFFNQKLNIKSYIISSFLYPFFSFYIAVKSMFFGFKWKERPFKK